MFKHRRRFRRWFTSGWLEKAVLDSPGKSASFCSINMRSSAFSACALVFTVLVSLICDGVRR